MKIQTTRIYAEVDNAIKNGYTTISAQGSSRSSKTYNIVIFLVVYLLSHKNTVLTVARATLPALKGSVYRDFLEIFQKLEITSDLRINKSDLSVHFPNGSFIEFISTDSEQKLRGRKRNILYVNEANELKFIEWQQLKMRTTKFAIVDYNPSFTEGHWICDLNKEDKTYHFITTYKDNPFLEQTIIDEIESLQWKNPSLWQVYGLGKMAIVEGLVFPNINEIDYNLIPISARKHRFVGIDFGYETDPTAIVDVYFSGDNVYIDEVCYRTKMLTSDIINELKLHNQKEHTNIKIISESADPRLVDEIFNAGLDIHPVKKYGGSVMAGIMKMQEYKIHVTTRSANVIKEFKNYTYRQDKNGSWLNEPIDAFNHAIDSIRYVFLTEILGNNGNGLTAEEIADIL